MLALMYFGDVVFAVSGALVAGRKRMDIIGFVLIGTITGIGGGTLRDLLLGRTVWWTQQPMELVLCVVLIRLAVPEAIAESLAFLSCFLLRAAAVIFDIRMGPPGEFLRIGGKQQNKDDA
jgi:uncharacterized membrane protein YeiH